MSCNMCGGPQKMVGKQRNSSVNPTARQGNKMRF